MSSSVAVGHVGLSAILPTLGLIGRTAAGLPTTILANHPGFAHTAGMQMPVETLAAMVDAIEANGWLTDIAAVLTGYLPSAAHVDVAASTVARVRQHNPSARYVCDPVLGDDPKGLYIDAAAATALSDRLVPAADILLPNRFELGHLTGLAVTSPEAAIAAARALAVPQVLAKSIPAAGDRLANILVGPKTITAASMPRLTGVPNGTGDMFSALIAAGWPVERATAALGAVIGASRDCGHLAIVESADLWRTAPPLALEQIA